MLHSGSIQPWVFFHLSCAKSVVARGARSMGPEAELLHHFANHWSTRETLPCKRHGNLSQELHVGVALISPQKNQLFPNLLVAQPSRFPLILVRSNMVMESCQVVEDLPIETCNFQCKKLISFPDLKKTRCFFMVN